MEELKQIIADVWKAAELLDLQGYVLSVTLTSLVVSYVIFHSIVKLYDEEGRTPHGKITNAFIYGFFAPWLVLVVFGFLILLAFQSQNFAVLVILLLIMFPIAIAAPIVVYVHVLECSFPRAFLFLVVPAGLMGTFGMALSIVLPWMALVSKEQKLALQDFLTEVNGDENRDFSTLSMEDPFERLHRLANREEVTKLALEGDFHKLNAAEVTLVERFIESEAEDLKQQRPYVGLMTPDELKTYKKRLADLRNVNKKYREAYASSSR